MGHFSIDDDIKENNEFHHKELIDTFFSQGSDKKETTKSKRKMDKRLLFSILIAIIILAIFSIASIIYIKANYTTASGSFHELRSVASLLQEGRPSKLRVKNAYFDGTASSRSSFLSFSVKLAASGSGQTSSLIITFKEPVDLRKKYISIVAKTNSATGRTRLLLEDADYHKCEFVDVKFSTRRWSANNIVVPRKKIFNMSEVTEMAIEFEDADPDAFLYLKNISISEGV